MHVTEVIVCRLPSRGETWTVEAVEEASVFDEGTTLSLLEGGRHSLLLGKL